MKKQIVLWGKSEDEKDILITLRLRVADKKIDLWAFNKEDLDEEFVEQMFQDWQEIDTSKFPENHFYLEREVSSSELLPENFKTTQTDLVIRAEKEWYFQVLAYQMYEQLKADIAAFGQQVVGLSDFSQDVWDEAKAYSEKIKQHAIERTLLRSQVTELRKTLDTSFTKLKSLLSTGSVEFEKEAQENFEAVKAKLNEFKQKLEGNPNMKELFEQLKAYQTKVKDVKLKTAQRKDVWKLMNDTFNLLKAKRKHSAANRIESRMAGLKKAIDRMSGSIKRDEKDLAFQKKRMENTGSKLEVQLREAKVQMLKTTIDSKSVKLDDMNKTYEGLEKDLADLKKRLKAEEEKAKASAELNNENTDKKASDEKPETETSKPEVLVEDKQVVEAEKKEKAKENESEERLAKPAQDKGKGEDVKPEEVKAAPEKEEKEVLANKVDEPKKEVVDEVRKVDVEGGESEVDAILEKE